MLEPVVVVMRDDDAALLREALAKLPPLNLDQRALALNGWTDEMLMFGRVIGLLCDLIRSGDIEVTVGEEARRG
jgi:hypothetical protein